MKIDCKRSIPWDSEENQPGTGSYTSACSIQTEQTRLALSIVMMKLKKVRSW